MEKLKTMSDLANTILHDQTKYFTDKEIIKQIFKTTNNPYDLKTIISRLTIIDSYYSTQMNKRYYGIEAIAEKLWSIAPKDENKLKELFSNYPQDLQNQQINALFSHKHYGIHKNGTNAGKAISLISKYAYYQTDYNFPIYDSLAQMVLPLIMKKIFQDEQIIYPTNASEINRFIISINKLNELSRINNYDKLDNLLWLTGKILKGNFSLVFQNRENYRIFANQVTENTPFETDFSKRILLFIRNNRERLNEIIQNENLCKFIEFSLSLMD